LPEQQSALVAHVLPTVMQLPGATAWQVVLHRVVQHSLPLAHASPRLLHTAPPHWLPAQTALQHWVDCVQLPPVGVQAPPVTAQVCEPVSHAPEQQPTPLVHACPGVPQEKPPSPTAASAPLLVLSLQAAPRKPLTRTNPTRTWRMGTSTSQNWQK
jgi:hypothetical protein